MRCDDVVRELARETISPELRVLVESHLTRCDACRSVDRALQGIDDALERHPVWKPPPGFAGQVVARMPEVIVVPNSGFRPALAGVARAAVLGAVLAAAGYASALALDGVIAGGALAGDVTPALEAYERMVVTSVRVLATSAVPLGWALAGVSLWMAARFTRRALT